MNINDFDLGDIPIAPAPRRNLKHRLLNQWNKFKGCACAGIGTQAGMHSLCFIFASVSGVGGGVVSSTLAPLVNGRGIVGLTAAESLQYLAAPILAVPISYGIDKLRATEYSLSKAGVAFSIAVSATFGISALLPHQHDAYMADMWLQRQSAETQDRVRSLAFSTNQTITETVIGICGNNPEIKAEMDRLKNPAYERVLQYFRKSIDIQ